MRTFSRKAILCCGGAVLATVCASTAWAQAKSFDVPSEDAVNSIPEFARQAGVQIVAPADQLEGLKTGPVKGNFEIRAGLSELLRGTGLQVAQSDDQTIILKTPRKNVSAAPTDGAVPSNTRADLHVAQADSNSERASGSRGGEGTGAVETPTESVVVTGTRIRTNGNDLPTPVTVVSAAQLQATTPTSIPDGLNKLPIFASQYTSSSSPLGSNGIGGIPTGNYLDIRGLNPIRTLILEDGRRVPGTNYDTTVDVDMLPQMLMQRVEVVTGGASAVYGSDAVAGVVNFILDTKFEGLKGLIQGGISNYADDKSFRAGIAGGEDIGDHGHLVWSFEYYHRDGIPSENDRPYGALAASIVGSGTAASPYYMITDTRRSNLAFGGLVTTGPFTGQQFGPGGVLEPFNTGTATPTANYNVGGDGAYESGEYMLTSFTSAQGFGHYEYDFNDGITGYVQTSYAMSRVFSNGTSVPFYASAFPLTIYSGNAFLLPQYQSTLTSTNTPSFQLNIYDNQVAQEFSWTTQTSAASVTAGLKGTLFSNFNWDAYYTHGESRIQETTTNNINGEHLYAALDAVKDPATGNIVCNVSLTAPGAFPGCVPLDLFGAGSASRAAMNYIQGDTLWTAHNGLDDFAANVTGPLFDDWAGPVQMALGVEYRLLSLVVTSNVPDNTFNPQYLRVGADGHTVFAKNLAWVKQVQAPASGAENVYEGDVELDVPLLKNLPLAEYVSLNTAYRYTDYSISGSANTWKLGLEWQVFNDLKLRATRSRDFRAPTLWDLYQQQTVTSDVFNDVLTNTKSAANEISGGNPNLKPEVARNTTAGFVYTPSWIQNFSVSVDYFHVAIDNALSLVTGSDPSVQAICNSSGGKSSLCSLIVRPFPITNTTPANYPTLIYSVNANASHVYAEGIDLEANYQIDLENLGWSGLLNIRGLWTHQPTYKTQTIPGATITNAAGTAQTPEDRGNLAVDYKIDSLTFDLTERYYSSFHQSADPTIVWRDPPVPAYFLTDINVAYDFIAAGQPLTSFVSINNLFNAQGNLYMTPGANPGGQYPTAPFVDNIGRYYTVGVRFRL